MKRLRYLAAAVLLALVSAGALPAQSKPASPDTKTKQAADSVPAGKLVDINSASMTELKAVPGIGDAYASKIISGRPYKSKAQLKSRKIVPSGVYDKISPYLVAKQK